MFALLESWSEKFISFLNTLAMYSNQLGKGDRLKNNFFFFKNNFLKMINKGELPISLELEAADSPQ